MNPVIQIASLLFVFLVSSAAAQTNETVLYSFGSSLSSDGVDPGGGVAFDSSGNIYGTTTLGGEYGYGTAFRLVPSGGAWLETILYSFCVSGPPQCSDGSLPESQLVFDPQGNLYGTTLNGGDGTRCGAGETCGTVFKLSPPSSKNGQWTETVIWNFGTFAGDGCTPSPTMVWDESGDLYGTTGGCGANLAGTVFELSPVGNAWAETTLYNFCELGSPCSDGAEPAAGVVFGPSGDLYGTTLYGGNHNRGVVFALQPPISGGEWTESVLYRFGPGGPGRNPLGGVSFDDAGNLYGSVSYGGTGQGGLYRLTPSGTERSFRFAGLEGTTPAANLIIDNKTKTAYSTTNSGGPRSAGLVFQVKGSQETVLYNFCSLPQCTDGDTPFGPITEKGRNLYGTTAAGGENGTGVVYEISE